MDVLMGAKPPVQKLEMANHRPLRNARDASMPANAHMTASTAVPTQMKPSDNFAMNWAVCTMLGTTCSLRPSDIYRLAPERLPNRPNDNATTTRPKPPSKIVTKRHMLSAQERWSRSEMMLTPVVVMPETPSNMASRNVL